MNAPNSLGRKALLKAQEVRTKLHLGAGTPISGIEAAIRLGMEVRIESLPTVEGLYHKSNPGPLVIVGNQRSIGRQSFNGAHEIGHDAFNHGSMIDPKVEDRQAKTPEEQLADGFARHFLMPMVGVLSAFKARGLNIKAPEPVDIYRVANYFEVGYSTLINQLHYTFKVIGVEKREELLKVTPKQIRNSFVRTEELCELLVVDEHWLERPIDLRVGDYIHVPAGTVAEGPGLALVHEDEESWLYQAKKQSIGRLLKEGSGWGQFVRVSERLFSGLAEHRHLERDENDTDN